MFLVFIDFFGSCDFVLLRVLMLEDLESLHRKLGFMNQLLGSSPMTTLTRLLQDHTS